MRATPVRAADETEPPEAARPHSLFGEILDWMLAPLLLWPMSIAVTYLVAKTIANGPFDRALETNAYVLAQQMHPVNGVAERRCRSGARLPARRRRRQRLFPGARHARRGRGRRRHAAAARRRPAAAGRRRVPRRQLRGNDVRVAYTTSRCRRRAARSRCSCRSARRSTSARWPTKSSRA
jgi:two-component system sensor histidine kinase TctE